MLAGWAAAVTFLGLVLGSLVTNVDQMVTPQTRQFLEKLGGSGSILDVFLSVEFSIAALAVSGYAIASVLRLSSEEASGHAEVVLSTATERRAWYASHTVIALAGSAALLLMSVAVSLSLALQNGDLAGTFGTVVPAGLVQVPGIWVVAGLAAALFGLAQARDRGLGRARALPPARRAGGPVLAARAGHAPLALRARAPGARGGHHGHTRAGAARWHWPWSRPEPLSSSAAT